MKNAITFLSLCLFLVCGMNKSIAQDGGGTDYEKAVKIGPMGFLFGSYNATFEKQLKEKTSFVVGARFSNFGLNDIDYTAFGVNGQYRFYFREAIEGPYFAPSAGIGFNGGDAVDSFTNIGIGANIGWQWVASGGFVVDLGLGARYRNGFGDGTDADFSGVLPSFQVQIGYAF